MVIIETSAAKPTVNRQTNWSFGNLQGNPISLEEFLAQEEASGFSFFEGEEPWLKGLRELSWQTFFRVCTEEMDDLSQKAIKLVIEYCLEILDESAKKIRGKVSLARLEDALKAEYDEQYDNKVYQYHWALRHPVVKHAITKALANRFSAA